MNKLISRKQQGSALVIVIIVVLCAIIAALGFVLWKNNFMPKSDTATTSTQQKDETSSANTAATETKSVNLSYESQLYTFEYPQTGWQVTEDRYELNGQSYVTPIAKTSDWMQQGMAPSAGASVSIHTSTATQSLAEMKNSAASFSGGIAKDLQNTKIDGVDAYSYRMSYEGEHYHTVCIHNGSVYDIHYEYAYNIEASTHIDGYNTIVSTFTFK